jgi:hypothetical protein
MGELVQPQNVYEEQINKLIEMVERQWDREQFPLVYESLLAIHIAQVRSLNLIDETASPHELDVLGISFEKGGTSVLADGYLVAGKLTLDQARYVFGYGTFTQMMDDMEDIDQDKNGNYMSLFSQTAGNWPLDNMANRVFHFGRAVLHDLDAFDNKDSVNLKALIHNNIDPILVDIISRNGKNYTKEYLIKLEKHSFSTFKMIRNQRRKLQRRKLDWEKLIGIFLTTA